MAVHFPECGTTNNQLNTLCWGFWTVWFWFYETTVFTGDRGASESNAGNNSQKKWTLLFFQRRVSIPCYTGNVFSQLTQQVYCLSWKMELAFHSRHAPTIPVITHSHVVSSANWWGTCIFEKGISSSSSHLNAKTKNTFETADACFLGLLSFHISFFK